jgi:solute carrier family 8 (sodium/calcium exchanger)
MYGFSCLHYSVSEASGSLKIMVLNKTGVAGQVRVCTQDDAAKAGEDYEAVDTLLNFAKGEKQKFIEVLIKDDDSWEPDEDFYVQLFDPETQEELEGRDTRTRVTIIDDDKPGAIYFQESKTVQADASQPTVSVTIERRNGSDGEVTVQYTTQDLDETANTATEGVDYKHASGILVFGHNQTQKDIVIDIIPKDTEEVRDESFLVQLSNVTPAGAKLSKKSYMVVNIVTDAKAKKQQEALAQLLKKIEEEEEITWVGQIINSCMLHPTKNEDGDIEDVEAMDAFVHFASIFWKLLFYCTVPPPHYCGGWACFGASLSMIGVCTFVVGDFANLFGCTLFIRTTVTAISFVALGTSLPDTFASMTAAVQDKYADPALGNVTGSNAVNVFLGLGLPWMIACAWESS